MTTLGLPFSLSSFLKSVLPSDKGDAASIWLLHVSRSLAFCLLTSFSFSMYCTLRTEQRCYFLQPSHAEDGLPACLTSRVSRRCRKPEAGRRKSTLGPAVVDCSEVPLDFVRRGVVIELVADVNMDLNRGDINVVDR